MQTFQVQNILQIEQKTTGWMILESLFKPNYLYNTLGSILPYSGVEGKSQHNYYIKDLNKNTEIILSRRS